MTLQGLGVAAAVVMTALTLTFHTPNDRHLNRQELIEKVQKRLYPPFEKSVEGGPEDLTYYALSQAQIDDLVRFYQDRREPIPYIPQAWDCDDMSREFMMISRAWNVRRNGSLIRCVPAVGEVIVKVEGQYDLFPGSPEVFGYHVINVILRDDGQWFFFESQTQKLWPIEGPLYEGVIEVLRVNL